MKGHNYGNCHKCCKFHIHPQGNLGKRCKYGPMSAMHKQKLSLAHRTFVLSYEEFFNLYWGKQLSDAQIARLYGVTRLAILKRRNKYNIPARSLSESTCGYLNGFYGKNHSNTKWSHRQQSGSNNPFYGKHHSEKTKRMMSIKKKQLCKDTDFLQRLMIARGISPNRSELCLTNILNTHFAGYWKFVGDGKDGTIIGGKIPDWINVNGKKAVIEMFSDYWHLRPGQSPTRTKEGMLHHYEEYGMACLIVDYKEVRNETQVVAKIKQFMEAL